MTSYEAIQFLDNMKHEEAGRAIGKDGFYEDLMGYHVQALNMAIKALRQEPSGDLISRQAVLDLLFNSYIKTELTSIGYASKEYAELCVDELNELPSVNPQPKTGHWEWVQYDYNPKLGNWHCSECRSVVVECVYKNEKAGIPLYKYCPQCGAKMVEPQENNDKCKNCEYYHNPDYTRCHKCKAESEDKECTKKI